MAALITTINRYQGLAADDKPTDASAGSTWYSVDTGAWLVWDGDSWEVYTFPLLDATSPTLPSVDEKAAMFAAAAPDATNPFLTEAALADAATLPALAAAIGVPVVDNPATAQSITDALIDLGLVTQAAP